MARLHVQALVDVEIGCQEGRHTKTVVDLAQDWSNQSEATCATGKGKANRLLTIQSRDLIRLIAMISGTYTIASNEPGTVEIAGWELFHISSHGLRSPISSEPIMMVSGVHGGHVFFVFRDCVRRLHYGCTVGLELIKLG
jgi:hypothetical protein